MRNQEIFLETQKNVKKSGNIWIFQLYPLPLHQLILCLTKYERQKYENSKCIICIRNLRDDDLVRMQQGSNERQMDGARQSTDSAYPW